MTIGKKDIVMVLVVLLIIGLPAWWYASGNEHRKAEAEFELLVEFAQRQNIEIAIIKQAEELKQLKEQMKPKEQAPIKE